MQAVLLWLPTNHKKFFLKTLQQSFDDRAAASLAQTRCASFGDLFFNWTNQ
jgi:hypothetical protein